MQVFKAALCTVAMVFISNSACADDSTSKVREGMKFYSSEQFEEASKSFAEASESLEKAKSDMAAIAAFDEACALHRKGDLELAKDRYLKAGLSQNKGIATSAHYNLGLIASEQARKLAGESPESVPPDKRKEILAELSKAIDSFRHCLELQPQHSSARRNLELLRQWNKYYADRWREADLKRRRDETNLIQFLEYLVQTQLTLKETVGTFRSNTSPNAFAELKRLQEELREEIPYLKDKIESDLRPKEEDSNSTSSQSKTPKVNEELERGIALLSGWADDAASKMVAVEKELMKRESSAATDKQQKAADQLDQIWDAVVPFHPLLAKELLDQTQIAKQFTPPASIAATASDDTASETNEETASQPQKLDVKDNEWGPLVEKQERGLRKARLLVPKAEAELAQVESQPKPDDAVTDIPQVGNDPVAQAVPKVDPEAIKAGYQKALELAPKAVEEMEAAVQQLGKRDREQAATHAEEARRILQEIQDAQPKNPEQEQQDQNKEQEKNQEKGQNEKKEEKGNDSKDGKEKQEEQNKDKQDEKKQSDDDKKDKKDKNDKDKKGEQRQEPKVSQDRIEEALRRVREREQEKRERDRELKARIFGRVPVDKDW